jgi:hypothetical protein
VLEEAKGGTAVAEDQRGAIVRQAPALSRVGECPTQVECCQVVSECDLRPPRQSQQLAVSPSAKYAGATERCCATSPVSSLTFRSEERP